MYVNYGIFILQSSNVFVDIQIVEYLMILSVSSVPPATLYPVGLLEGAAQTRAERQSGHLDQGQDRRAGQYVLEEVCGKSGEGKGDTNCDLDCISFEYYGSLIM